MRDRGSPPGVFASLALGLVLATGCSSGIRLAEVDGTVTKGGEIQPKLWVQFRPKEGGRLAEARTDATGRYRLDYSRGREGAPLGLHRVLVYAGGDLNSEGMEISPRKRIFEGEFEVKSGSNSIDIALP